MIEAGYIILLVIAPFDTLMELVPNLGTLPCAIIILFLKYPTDPVWKIEVVIPFPIYMVLL